MGGCLGRELSAEERETVRAWQRSENRVKFNRARIVILAEHTANAAVIARAVGVHVQTVRDLARVFRQEGLAGLAPKPRPGRPRKLADAAGDRLVTLLHESPTEHGGDDGRWTLETAAQALAQELGLESVGRESVRQLLKGRRHSWQRAKEWLVSPDPRYAFKKSGVSG